MTMHPTNPRQLRSLLLFAFGWLFAAASLSAQSSATGTIQGRVFNPVTQQYVRNAEVRLDGTNMVTNTESDGSFQFPNVPAGPASITVIYTGYKTDNEKFTVTAGQTATRDINLVSTAATVGAGETVQLQAFTVSSERDGNSKAVMEQKRNMNVTTSVASDIFGDVTDGNVGEFLKYLPGVDVDYVESETRGPRLGGMDAQYTAVSFDGARLASADANRTGDLGRATSFEAFSISAIESIEISRTTSSDMDADAPGGTINMKTRRAFDRKGRLFRYNFSVNMNSEEFHFKKTYGPGGEREYKSRPNFALEYSDVFLNQRLGIVAAVNRVDSYTEQYRHNITYNLTPTAADPRRLVATALNFKDGAKNIAKDTYSLTMDFKASPRLVLSNTVIYNYALGQFYNRELTFNAAANNANVNIGRATVLGDGATEVRTNGLASNTSRNSALAGTNASKRTITFTMIPRFEYKLPSWTIDGAGTYSNSRNNYESLEQGHTRSDDLNSITSDFTATRPSITSSEWTIQQTSGADWFNLANRTNPRVTNEGRYANTEAYTGELNARWTTPLRSFPTSIKFGTKWNEEARRNGNETSYYTYSYIGPGGNVVGPTGTIATTGTWAAYPSQNPWDTGGNHFVTTNNSAGQTLVIPRPDSTAIGGLFREHPEYFTNIATADNYYNAFIAPRRNVTQTVTAGYAMADVRVTQTVQVRTGIRWEKTELDSRDFDPKTKAEMVAAGFSLNTAARPTTIAGYNYQYLTNPLITRSSAYDNYFPMISAKYSPTRDLQFHFGFNKAIARVPVDNLSGAWLINEDTQVITSPNPNLLPEYSKNFAARVAYYLQPAGELAFTVTQNTIRNLRETRLGTAEEFGVTDPEYANYSFQSPFNVASPRRHRNFEISYRQSLPFKQELLRGISLSAAYSRSYADARRSGLTPNRATAGVNYRYKRFSARVNAVWRDDTPWGAVSEYGYYRRHDTKYDVGGEYSFSQRFSLFFQGRNILNDSQTWMQTPGGNVEGQGAAVRIRENYGANWNFGVKGTF